MRQTTLSNRISVKIKLLRLGGGGGGGILGLTNTKIMQNWFLKKKKN